MAEPTDLPAAPSGLLPDFMNDPHYAISTTEGEEGTTDVDTCRICRGEGSDTEPLFHPCKCSGSIKHVHQDCLMEWLSHSQKKHCELCKTPFRFTKLYSPNMPQTLPPSVFFRHFLLHSARNITTWLRFCVVGMVWLGCLPFMIRQVWRILFWFSDGGWPSEFLGTNLVGNLTTKTMEMARQFELAIMAGNGTSPVTPLSAAQTTSASMGGIVDAIIGVLEPFSNAVNISSSDPLILGFMKSLYYGFGIPGVTISEEPFTNTSDPRLRSFLGMPPIIRSTSLLSEVSFLKTLTRHDLINRGIIAIAEGYIITIVVVVAFILVFLIREWVVQQQPGINMGAGFNAEFPGERVREEVDPEFRRNAILRPGPAGVAINNAPEARDMADRPIAPHRRRNIELDAPNDAVLDVRARENAQYIDRELPPDDVDNFSRIVRNRPAPVRDAMSPAAVIQRRLTETPQPKKTEEFLAIWRRAHGVPEDVLQIIEEEYQSSDMHYWIIAMKALLKDPVPQKESVSWSSPDEAIPSNHSAIPSEKTPVKSGSDSGSGTSDSWVDVANQLNYRKGSSAVDSSRPSSNDHVFESSSMSNVKGKGKERETTNEPFFDPTAQRLPGMNFSKWNQGPAPSETPSLPLFAAAAGSRPRATSDGPHPRDSISPLAHNNWSFSNLDKENTQPRIVSSNEVQHAGASTWDFEPKLQVNLVDGQTPGSPAWRAAQDIRVKEAILKAREVVEAQKSVSGGSTSNVDPAVGPSWKLGQTYPYENHRLNDVPSKPDIKAGYQEDSQEANEFVQIVGRDGIARTYQDVFGKSAANSVSDSETEEGDEAAHHNPEPNPFALDTPLPLPRQPIVQHPPEAQGILGNVIEFLWGGNGEEQPEDQGANDEHVVHDIAAEAPFVPVAHRDLFDQEDEPPEQDREVAEAAIAAGLDPNDPDAIDDAEDFEGIMELIGMRGPIFSLVQNAVFCAVLLSLTVGFGVWIPYNIGRISLLLAANPGPTFKLPLRLVFWCAAFLQDSVVSLAGAISYCSIMAVSLPLRFFISPATGATLATSALRLSYDALNRILDSTVTSMVNGSDTEMFLFSAASHEALLTVKYLIIDTIDDVGKNVIYLFVGDYEVALAGFGNTVLSFLMEAYKLLLELPSLLAKPDTWVISLEVAKRSTPLDLELSVWNSADRVWATLAGYVTLFILGALYVKKGTPFSSGAVGREWEATVIDLLHQAGGVMKVILIISIEMLVFPLYCGLLLDAALLPLFEGATIFSRIVFTFDSPCTSIFVHWFVGTCYMFHFALFVSMCRKIMRKGVLYFIRDPDDPTFHPVRDVLERNVATQLRKILFSALVYGALVVICLGGVVWGLSFAFNGVLPIHWSSNEPVLEFPIDLLFYNFLMPVAVKFFKPSDGLHSMYSWWFRQCARMLRLTWFMFDERQLDEEGYTVRRSWGEVFGGIKGDPLNAVKEGSLRQPFAEHPELGAYFRQNGRFVRAPASDQVRIPKGSQIFLEVDEANNRIDGETDRPDGVHSRNSDLYKQVYIPPHFRLRIFAFILSIWIFAALTGVCITILPLVFGRMIFAQIIPSHVRKNDIYAFSIGIYTLGSALYATLHLRRFISYVATSFSLSIETPRNILRLVATSAVLAARIMWTYGAFILLLPTLFAFVVEFYAIVPLHTYFFPNEPHTIHFVQSWTLGLLYVKLTTRFILLYSESRPAISLRAITRNGYLNPDAWLATRSFILPAAIALGSAIAWPWLLARLVLTTIYNKASEEQNIMVYRFAYPLVLAAILCSLVIVWLMSCIKGWRMRIRDEVYLIGERLHNFGERKSGAGVKSVGLRRLET